MSNIVRTDSWISIYWSKLSDAKFSILYYISFGQRLRRENLLWSLLRLMFFKVQQLSYSFIVSIIKRNHYKWHMKISKWIKYWKMASLKIANLLKAVILWMVVNGMPCLPTIQNIKLQFKNRLLHYHSKNRYTSLLLLTKLGGYNFTSLTLWLLSSSLCSN